MIFKDYIVVDDFLDKPEQLLMLAKIPRFFYTNETQLMPGISIRPDDSNKPKATWRGYRTPSLEAISQAVVKPLAKKIINTAFNGLPNPSYEGNIYLQYGTEDIPLSDEVDFHTDPCAFASIIYLNKEAPSDSGTFIKLNDEIIKIENKFNRLVLYKGNTIHRPGKWFGTDISSARLTLLFFINKIEFSSL